MRVATEKEEEIKNKGRASNMRSCKLIPQTKEKRKEEIN